MKLRYYMKSNNLKVELGGRNFPDMLYGFESLQSLRSWFFREDLYEEVSDMGCVIEELDVLEEYIILGSFQLLFKPEQATLIKSYRISEVVL